MNLFLATTSSPDDNCTYRESHQEPKQKLDNLEESNIDDSWSTDGKKTLRKLELIHDTPHPYQKTTPKQFVGSWRTDQNSTQPETIWPKVWSSMSNCSLSKAKQQEVLDKPTTPAARQKWKILRDSSRQISKESGGPPSLSEGRLSLTKKKRNRKKKAEEQNGRTKQLVGQ